MAENIIPPNMEYGLTPTEIAAANALNGLQKDHDALLKALGKIARTGDDGTQDQLAPDMWRACIDIAKDAITRSAIGKKREPSKADPSNLSARHIKLLKNGARYNWIGLSDDMGIRTGELAALGELERAGMVEEVTEDLPPGPPSMNPRRITELGRAALAAVESP